VRRDAQTRLGRPSNDPAYALPALARSHSEMRGARAPPARHDASHAAANANPARALGITRA
jgi:hypothetical protein